MSKDTVSWLIYRPMHAILHGSCNGLFLWRRVSVALKMRVANLGSGLRLVAGAPAPGGVAAWHHFPVHEYPEMSIFAMFYKGWRKVGFH